MSARKLWSSFWSTATGVSIRIKIMGIVVVLILLFGLVTTFQIRSNLTSTLSDQLEKQGASIGSDLAARSADLVLTNNIFALHELIRDTVENNEGVRYAFVLGPNDAILAHSFEDGLPLNLAEANSAQPDTRFKIELLDTEEGIMHDVAVPILDGRAGVARIGMSEQHLRETVAAMTRQLLLVTALVSLVGLIAAYLLTAVLAKPILELVEVTKAITKGDLKRKASIWAKDEIGKLSEAFNTMTSRLDESRIKSEEFNRQLRERNRELSSLNAIANEVSSPLALSDKMRIALDKVLVAMGLTIGWVSLLDKDGEEAVIVCQTGLSEEAIQRIASVVPSTCACAEAINNKSTIVVSGLSAICPALGTGSDKGQPLLCHIAVPLVSKSEVLGLLNVASHEPMQFKNEDLEFLNSIGHQIGVAIENAKLWEELKSKEKIRGQLLEKVISAQEAERKRIARELHDQTSQSLTSLMIGLRTIEEPPNLERLRKGIGDLKKLTTKTLNEVHSLALELRPSSLDDLGLVITLEQYTKEYAERFGIDADFQATGFDEKRLSPEKEIALYRIVQEALTNVAKHAAAKSVSVLLERRGSSVVAIIEDDGKGFDIRKLQETKERNLGLYGMQERATLVNGTLTIESTPGEGTAIFVEVPLDE